MGIPRKDALKRLQCLAGQVELHLDKIAKMPESLSVPHYRHEILNWLSDMRAVLPQVGKRTAAQWQAKIDSFQVALSE